jgi:hypothetical protein
MNDEINLPENEMISAQTREAIRDVAKRLDRE